MSNDKNPWGKNHQKPDKPNKPKSPWGIPGAQKRPGTNGQGDEKSSDLERMIHNFSFRPGKQNGNRDGKGLGFPKWIYALLGVVAVFFLCFYTVDERQQAVVLRFGEYNRTTYPGLNFKLPTPLETVIIHNLAVNQIDISGSPRTSLMLTGDENIVNIDFSIFWKISDPRNFTFNVDVPDVAVRAVAESAMREVVGKNTLENIITTGRQDITLSVRDLIQEILDGYQIGVEITGVQLQKAGPPAGGGVIDAFRDVVNATQDAETKVNNATAIQNDIVPKARGEAVQIIQDAEAYRERVVAEAEGEAERFKLVLEEYLHAPEVTRQRIYLETLEALYGPANKIILDEGAGQGVVPYLPLDQLQKSKREQ